MRMIKLSSIKRELGLSLGRNSSQVILFFDVGMPNMPYVYAMDFIDVLKKKHASGGYKKMVRFHFPGKMMMLGKNSLYFWSLMCDFVVA